MKSIASLISLVGTLCLCCMLPAAGYRAQTQGSFKDVPSDHWAYKAITEFQRNTILLGYPVGFFSGKRVLTRYEFALAIKRAIENVLPSPASTGKSTGAGGVSAEPTITSDQFKSFNRLLDEFGADLAGIQVNVAQVKLRLDAVTGAKTVLGHSDAVTRQDTAPTRGLQPDSLLYPLYGYAGAYRLPLFDLESPYGLNLMSRIGNTTVNLFAGGNAGQAGVNGSGELPGSTAAPLAIAPPVPQTAVTPLTNLTAANQKAGLRVEAPLFNAGTIGGSLVDLSNPGSGAIHGTDALVGGIDFSLRPIGRMNLSGQVSRSVLPSDPGVDIDNSTLNLNLRYSAGSVGVLGGFRYVDPGSEGLANWNRLSILSSLSSVEGPFFKLNYNLNPRTQFQIGSDLLTGVSNRSYSLGGGLATSPGTRDFLSTLSAGMEYKLWNFTSLTADWSGVYWDLPTGSSGPIESYINLGTGFRLRGNAMLKMGYQIGSFGNFSGLGGPTGSGQTYNAFTTQLNVKF